MDKGGDEKPLNLTVQDYEKIDCSNSNDSTEIDEEEKMTEKNIPAKSPSNGSPEPNCAICLEKLKNKSFTDSCFHTFCFACLVEWSKVKPECPLCKQKFKSIVHNVQNDMTFDEYHIQSRHSRINPMFSSTARPRIPSDVQLTRFRYTSTLTPQRLRERNARNPSDTYENQIMNHHMLFAPHSVQMFRRATTVDLARPPCDFRRRVYNESMWVINSSNSGRTRIATPEFYRSNPACTHRLLPWLNRELVVLLQNNESQITFVIELIMALISRFDMRSHEFFMHIKTYLGPRTRHFIHELYHYAISPYDMENYDLNADYDGFTNNLSPGELIRSLTTAPDEDNDDVLPIFSSRGDRSEQNSPIFQTHNFSKIVLKKKADSTWESIFNFPPPRHFNPGPSTSSSLPPDLGPATLSDDECQVIDVVRPKTPVLVNLSSGDETEPEQVTVSHQTTTLPKEVIDISSDNEDTQPIRSVGVQHMYMINQPSSSRSSNDNFVFPPYENYEIIFKNSTHYPFSSQPQVRRKERGHILPSSIVQTFELDRPSSTSSNQADSSINYCSSGYGSKYRSSDSNSEEDRPASKRLKLKSVVANFSYEKGKIKHESSKGHRRHKDKKRKKKKKKEKHSHKHKHRNSSDSDS